MVQNWFCLAISTHVYREERIAKSENKREIYKKRGENVEGKGIIMKREQWKM